MTDHRPLDFETETKAEKFRRLGNLRLAKAVDAIEAIESLSHKSNYDYTDEQVSTIIEVLDDAVADLKAAFDNGAPLPRRRNYL